MTFLSVQAEGSCIRRPGQPSGAHRRLLRQCGDDPRDRDLLESGIASWRHGFALAIVIGVEFSLLLELDYPFRGEVSIAPERWLFVRDLMSSGEQRG